MGTSFTNAVGNPPVCTSMAWWNWQASLFNYYIINTIYAWATTYFFSQGGSDSNDGRDNVGFSLSGASWNNSTRTLTKTGAFASYTWNSWDLIYISGGTGVTPGLYPISSKVNNDSIILGTSISGGAPTDVTSSSGPKKTLSAANTLLGSGASSIRCRFRRGDTWQESSGLNFTGANIDLDDYGDMSKNKPLWSRFATAYSSAGWTLTAAQTVVYERAETNTVAWLREKNDIRAGYIRATSIADVAANPGSYWWDSGSNKIYLQTRLGQAPTVTSIVYEAVYDNTGAGIKCSGDNIRIENMRLDGWSARYSASGGTNDNSSNYNLRYEGTGTNTCLCIGVEAYYSTYHNIGLNNSSGSLSGGILILVNCRAGWMISVDGTNFVGFASLGGQTFANSNWETVGGCLRQNGQNYNNVQYGGVGAPNYGHTDTAAGHTVGLFLCVSGTNTRNQYQEATPSVCANAPVLSGDLINCRAFIAEEKFVCREITAIDAANEGVASRYIGNSYALPYNGVYINCERESRYYSSLNEANHQEFGTFSGIWINSIFLMDFAGNKDISAVGGAAITASCVLNVAQWTMSCYNCSLEMRCNANTSLALIYVSAALNNSSNVATAGGLFNTCITFRNMTFGAGTWLGFNNSLSFINNNSYSGINASGTAKTDQYRGYSADTNGVDVTGLHPSTPAPNSPLISAVGGNQLVLPGNYRLEYDKNRRPRHKTQPCRGPYEPATTVQTASAILSA